MLFKVAGIFGCLFTLAWTVLCLVLLIDTVFTGNAEWSPWAADAAAARGEYIAGYVVALVFGGVGLYKLIQWTKPLL